LKVLVTGAGALLGQGLIKSLRLCKSNYNIVAVDPDPRAVGLYWSDTAYVVPLASAPDYLSVVCRILGRERPDAVLIGTDVELMAFAAHKIELETTYNTRIVVSPPEVIRIADDKWLTYEFLKSHGLPYPRSVLPDRMECLLNECGFPLVVKPRIGARSVGTSVVKNEAELRIALQMTTNPIIQECVATPRDEYTSGILVTEKGGEAVVTMRRDLRDGNTYRAYVEPDSLFNPFLLSTALTLGGYGPLNFQFRVADGVPKIFEINARFSGTTPLRAYAGFNEVDFLLRHLILDEPIPAPVLRKIVVLRYWEEIVVHTDQLIPHNVEGPLNDLCFEQPCESLHASSSSSDIMFSPAVANNADG
jgi:carbamoyl-phosphate synthase large subunit